MIRRTRPVLGTFVEITIPQNTRIESIEKAFDIIAEIEETLSFFHPESDVSKINNLPRNTRLSIHPHTYAVLSFAQELSLKSNGLFDVTIGDTLMEKGFLPSLFQKKSDANWSDIILLEDSLLTLNKEVCIDLGGIAKGYAVDCAIKILLEDGIAHGSINAGGDLRVFGDDPQPLFVRHPITPEHTIHLGNLLHNNAAATSAGYYSRTDNILPIVHPHNHQCIDHFDSVTVLADSCMIADALTKILLIDPDHAMVILKHFQARALLIRHNKETGDLHIFDSYTSEI